MSTATPPTTRPTLGRNVLALTAVSFFTDVSSEMIYPLLPAFLTSTLGASAGMLGIIEGAAESTASLLKLASGWWSDRARKRTPLILLGYGIATAMRPLVAIAQSGAQVLAIRVADRVGKGIRGAPRDALIADSVDPSIRGRAFGLHRTGDHTGAFLGPLIAFALLQWAGVEIRRVFWLAAIPGALAVLTVLIFVRDQPPVATRPQAESRAAPREALPRSFWAYLGVILLFALGNSTDAFLLLRASQLGVPVALAPILWAVLHASKSLTSAPGGALSDRIGRVPTLIGGWVIYAVVYVGFAYASAAWHAWALFVVYGLYFALSEGVERALVADVVPASLRGTAYGWYNLSLGLGLLPASILFGAVWDRAGSGTAFLMGAAIAGAATLALALLPRPARPARPASA